uniref:Uncharacterized protein n=1 Tax=Panagrellus redivivus TaxID=6233 RepID=A0A7E4VK67_PANRE
MGVILDRDKKRKRCRRNKRPRALSPEGGRRQCPAASGACPEKSADLVGYRHHFSDTAYRIRPGKSGTAQLCVMAVKQPLTDLQPHVRSRLIKCPEEPLKAVRRHNPFRHIKIGNHRCGWSRFLPTLEECRWVFMGKQ